MTTLTTTPPPVPPMPKESDLRRFPSYPPDFLSPIRRFPANECAQEYIYQAWEAESPNETFLLCQRALKIFPFSVDAFNAIAHIYNRYWDDNAKSLVAYQRALDCSRLLWPGTEEQEEILWGYIEHRPFLRTYHGLAIVNLELGNTETAIDQLRFLLRVNPSDNQGCRTILFSALIGLGKYDEAKDVAKTKSDGRKSGDCSFLWGYIILYYAKWKDGRCSEHFLKKALCRALQANYHVADLLLKDKAPTELPDYVSLGSMDEAVSCVMSLFSSWKRMVGLTEWLQEVRSSADCPKPPDDGTTLFNLLTRGKIVIVIQQGLFGRRKRILGTSDFYCMRGQALPEFKLPPGMKTHDPTKMVCFHLDNDVTSGEDFVSFNYDEVVEIPFWRILDEIKEWSADKSKEHSCSVCYEAAPQCCSKCKVTWYCSKECQKKGWKEGHKYKCDDFIKK